MVPTALALFLIGAAVGLYMATRIFRGLFPPTIAPVIHGGFVASGLLVALYAAAAPGAPMLVKVGAGILCVAALGGFFLLSFHIRKVPHPRPFVVVHALAAVTGVTCLLLSLV
jgi:FtsH-binding integral membrane protein